MKNELAYLLPVFFNLGRFVLFAGLPFLIFYVLFPKRFARHKIQARLAKHKDFVRELIYSAQSLLVFIGIAMLMTLTPLREYTQLYREIDAYPLWWMPLSVLFAVVMHDSYFYWMHRTIHHKKLYKRLHIVHHQSTNPSPFASHSFNLIEAFLEALVVPVIICLMPMHPIALLVFSLVALAFNVYGHLGYEIVPKWFRHSVLFEIMNTSVHHNLHHAKFKGNYGYYFRIWDRLMKTEHPAYVKTFDEIQAQRFGETTPARSMARHGWLLPGLLLLSLLPSMEAEPASILGDWKDGEEGGIITIYKAEGKYYGKVKAALDPREQKLIEGKTILVLKAFEETSSTTYCCGTFFLPRYRLELKGTLTLVDDNTLTVEAQYGWIKGSRTWVRN